MFFFIKFIIYKRFFWKKFHSKNRKMEYQMIFFQRKKIMMIFNIWSAGQFSHQIIESKFIFDHFTIINNNLLHHNNFAFWLWVCGNQKNKKKFYLVQVLNKKQNEKQNHKLKFWLEGISCCCWHRWNDYRCDHLTFTFVVVVKLMIMLEFTTIFLFFFGLRTNWY